MMNTPNEKGSQFESEVSTILDGLRQEYPSKVTVTEKSPINLQNDEVVFPDFHLVVSYPHERRHYLIECQNRERDSKSILHKIQHVRAKQAFKTFFFVYPESIAPELARALEAEGIVHLSIVKFREFVSKLSDLLRDLPADNQQIVHKNYDPPDYSMRTIDYTREAKEHLLRKINEFMKDKGFR